MTAGFVVLTYNRSEALLAVLRALAPQCAAGDTVVVADDLLQRGPRHIARGHPGDGRLGVGVEHRRRPVPAHPPGRPHLLAEPGAELLLFDKPTDPKPAP